MSWMTKFKAWVALRVMPQNELSKVVSGAPRDGQEDVHESAVLKSVKKSFHQQKKSMQIMAMKSHSAGCSVVGCNKQICFVRKPDKIVSSHKVERPMTKGKLKIHEEEVD